jgi:branched-chain amino acid transport system ATP-binding protein
MSAAAMLELRDTVAGYGAAPIIRGVSLRVGKGETVALLGPNGAGKSTLLAAITGTIRVRLGSIRFDGVEIIRLPSHAIVASGLVLVPEGRLIFAPFTVEDNLRLGAVRLAPGQALAERYDYVYRLFPRLSERRRQMAGSLSGGEQQMLAIGRGLMSRPRLLLLDEPSLGLSPILTKEIFGIIARINRETATTILVVEQNAAIALASAHDAYVMEVGRIVAAGTASELSAMTDVREFYLGGGLSRTGEGGRRQRWKRRKTWR